MKKTNFKILTISLLFLFFFGCNKDNSENSAKEENFDKDASYAFGMNVAMDMDEYMKSAGIVMNVDQFVQGMKDYLSGKKTRFTIIEAGQMIEAAFSKVMEGINAEEAQKEITFLAENSKKPGVNITSTGLQYEIIFETNGSKPHFTDTVLVHYTGKLLDGTLFDSSYERGAPAKFPLYGVIPGWGEGLQLMSVGSKYILYVPSEHGYGPNGIQNVIPPYSTLIFEVELLDILHEHE